MFNEPRGVITDLQVGFEQDNFYIREIRKVVCKSSSKRSKRNLHRTQLRWNGCTAGSRR